MEKVIIMYRGVAARVAQIWAGRFTTSTSLPDHMSHLY